MSHLARMMCKASLLQVKTTFATFRCDTGNALFPSILSHKMSPDVKVFVASLSDQWKNYTGVHLLKTPWNTRGGHPRHMEDLRKCPPFEERIPKCVWRGVTSGIDRGTGIRLSVVNELKDKTDIADVGFVRSHLPQIHVGKQRLTPSQQCHYKCVIVMDGWGFPGNLDWALATRSWTMIHSVHHVGFFDSLVPFEHFIPFTYDNITDAVRKSISQPRPPAPLKGLAHVNRLTPSSMLQDPQTVHSKVRTAARELKTPRTTFSRVCEYIYSLMPFEPAASTKSDSGTDAPPSSDKKQVSAVVWVFLAVGSILIGLIVVLVLFKSAKNGNPFAVLGAMDVIQGVAGVVGNAANKVQAS